ncbi:acetyltransferase domain-containing protein [Yersinia frederiksenii]|nr:acetyltransferase domain-containing protein [Yersinia frederiksenii]
MDINQSGKILYVLVFISLNAMSDHFNDDNVCFYSADNYVERSDSKRFCVPYYTEDEWLFSQWNNNISSIKIPLNIQVDIFSDFSFTGNAKSLYQDTNADDLRKYGLMSDISSYRVLPKTLYPASKRIVFNYHSDLFPEKYFGYNYYISHGHSIILTRKHHPTDADGQSSSIFYSHAGQIMTAFTGQGFDRNLYCLHTTDRRKNKLSAEVTFSYCDFSNLGQRWLPKKIEGKNVLVNQGTGTPLLLDEKGFYVDLNARESLVNHLSGRRVRSYYPEDEMDIDTIWFDDQYIEKLKSSAVRPFLQYKETFEMLNDVGHRDAVFHHLDELDDINIYWGSDEKKRWDVYYNAETQYLIAYNKSNEEGMLTEASCLSLVNNKSEGGSPVSFTYNRSSYSDDSISFRCDNGTAYNMYTHRWYFMPDQGYRYLVNGHENKVLHFYINDKPQRVTFRGALTGPKLGERIGLAVDFNERKPQDAIFIGNESLMHVLDVEKGVCEMSARAQNNGTLCGGLNTSWSSTDYNVLKASLCRFYIPWVLSQITNESPNHGAVAAALRQQATTLARLFAQNSDSLADNAALQQVKTLLVAFLRNEDSTKNPKIWDQVAYALNRVDVLIEWGKN